MKIKFAILLTLCFSLFFTSNNNIKPENNHTTEITEKASAQIHLTNPSKPKEEFTYILNRNSKKYILQIIPLLKQ